MERRVNGERNTAQFIAAAGLAVVVYLAFVWRFAFWCDDALISFRYSRNLAEGAGLCFNVGADPPVEGYSNLLWVIWLSLFELLDWNTPRWACITSAATGVALLIATLRFARRTFQLGNLGTLAVGLYFATLPPLVMWGTGGLATMPGALLLFLTYLALFDRRSRGWQVVTFAVLTCLMRLDGVIWVAMLLCAAVAVWWIEGRPRELLRDVIRVALAVVVVTTLHTLFRLWYHGDPLPNTLRVKAGFTPERLERGVRYVGMWLLALPSITLVLLAAARRWPGEHARVWLPAAVVLLGGVAGAVWVGGDFLPMWRFLLPAHAFVVLLLAATWHSVPHRRPLLAPILSAACIAISIAVCFEVSFTPSTVEAGIHFREGRRRVSEIEVWRQNQRLVRRTEALGRALALYTTPGESVIAGAVGGVGYYSDAFIYDRFGLVTRGIAEASEPHSGGEAGHDVRVPQTYFIPEGPTYLRAMVLLEGEEPPEIPESRGGYALAEMIDVERYPLPPREEFHGAKELVLLRLKPNVATSGER